MTQNFDRLTKINFNARMTEASKNLATKKQVQNALDLEHKKVSHVSFKQLYWLKSF